MLRTILIFSILFACFTQNAQSQNDIKSTSESDSITNGSVDVQGEIAAIDLIERYKKENEGKQIQGYRIQLYSGSRKGAFDLKADFMKKIPETPITVVYESPDFKAQVGDYRTKLEAEKAMEIIWPQYKSAFVVKTNIDLPRLSIEQANVSKD